MDHADGALQSLVSLADAYRRQALPQTAHVVQAVQGIYQGAVAGAACIFRGRISSQVLYAPGHAEFAVGLCGLVQIDHVGMGCVRASHTQFFGHGYVRHVVH